MNVISKKLELIYYLSECPICGGQEIWTNSDMRKQIHKCQHCSIQTESDSWLTEEIGTLHITLNENGAEIEDD